MSVLVWAAAEGSLSPVVAALACAGITLSVSRVIAAMHALRVGGFAAARPDDVTGLADRPAFLERTARALATDGTAAVLLIGLDRFRDVNETLGHQTGDRLLSVVAARFSTVLRPGDRLARVGGDEFAVLMRAAGADAARRMASRLQGTLSVPFPLAGLPVQMDASIGIAIAPGDGRTSVELLRHADTAMSAAKRGRSGYRFYGPDCALSSRERLRVRGELRGALRGGDIVMRYQPKSDLATGRVTGVEALVRWMHPVAGLRGPDTFLPEMEDAGLMPELTRYVLRAALGDCASWRAAGATLTVAVNVPASVIVDEGLPGAVMDALERVGLPPSALRLEITEDSLLARRDKAAGTMAALRKRGVRISLDDYGTGYCSLSYLRELPVDELKLDRSFVTNMLDEASTAEIVRSTVQLAHALNLRMVAEGVESSRTWAALSAWGCDEAQGYFLAKPMEAGKVLEFLGEWSQRTRPVVRRPVTYVAATGGCAGPPSVVPVTVHHRARPNLWSAGFHASSSSSSASSRRPGPARSRMTLS
jgi:diguanylate cyclase (GGDEF)-like protein